MKKICTYVVIFTACWLLVAGTVLQQEKLSSRLIRIHILANSDSGADQAEKLLVRDAVLAEVSALTADCASRQEAAAVLAAHAEELGRTAAGTAGRDVTVALSPEWYETRRYDGFSLPAGKYLSLQIKIGEAAGHNWWCVAFPSVCTAATAEELETTAVSAGFDGGDLRMMTGDDPDVEVRYFLLELISRLRDVIRG